MRRAWEAYKIRWEKEAEDLRVLEEKKLEFRIMLDKKREMYEVLTPEEKAEFKDSIRLFRHPKYAKNNGEFYQTSEEQMGYDSYSKAFKKYLKENYNISSFESNPLNDQSKSKKGHEKHENL